MSLLLSRLRLSLLVSASAVLLLSAHALALAEVAVTLSLDDSSLTPGQTTTAHVAASITNPTSSNDGLAAFDLNINILSTATIHFVPGSLQIAGNPVVLGAPDYPAMSDVNNPGGMTGIAALYLTPDDLGIGAPVSLFSFQIQADQLGTASVAVSSGAQTGLGTTIALVQGDPVATNFSDSIAYVQVVPEPASILWLLAGIAGLTLGPSRRAASRR
jgi:hypothetical protein